MMAYVVNSYSNTFKLFSFIQICLFFSGASVFYIGFSHLFINLENFSYLILFTSLIFNTFLFLIIAMLRFYFPSLTSNRVNKLKKFFLYIFFLIYFLFLFLAVFMPF